ncbi:MAG: iron-containing alcohol dehydrogenase [Verrucomicrobiota bacterium]
MKRLFNALFKPRGGPKAAKGSGISIEALTNGFEVDPSIRGFSHLPGGELVFAPGALSQLGQKARGLGCQRALLVTDPGLRAVGHESRAIEYLEGAGLSVVVFDEVRENPTTKDVERAVRVAREGNVDLIVGLGGGSSMDTAKGCNFILTNGGEMKDYWGVGKASKPMLPLIAVPTTSGTGSECQSFALIADEVTHMKMACGDKKAAAKVSILDPELTITQPNSVTALTGIDAIAHSIETAVCKKRNAISSEYSRLAFHLLNSGFEQVLADPANLEARAKMQLGAAYAGTAIENSMLGAAHSTANPLSANFGTVHGQAVGTMLPSVIRWNSSDPEIEKIYQSLAPGLDLRVEELLAKCGMDKTASELGVTSQNVAKLAEEASTQWTAQFNPVAIDSPSCEKIYEMAM